MIVEKSLPIHHPKSDWLRWHSILWCLQVFLYLYLINCLYNVFVSVSQINKGELFCRRGWQKAHWFLSWPVYFWSAVAIPLEDCAWSEESSRNCNWSRFVFNLAVVKKVTIFFNNVMYLDDAFRSLVGPYIHGLFEIVIYLFSQIVWLCIISWSLLQ